MHNGLILSNLLTRFRIRVPLLKLIADVLARVSVLGMFWYGCGLVHSGRPRAWTAAIVGRTAVFGSGDRWWRMVVAGPLRCAVANVGFDGAAAAVLKPSVCTCAEFVAIQWLAICLRGCLSRCVSDGM